MSKAGFSAVSPSYGASVLPRRVASQKRRSGQSAQQLRSGERVDRRTLADVADRDELVRPMGDSKQARPIGEGGDATRGVEARFEEAGAHLDRRGFARQACHMAGQRQAERLLRRSGGGCLLLERLDLEAFEQVEQPALLLFEVLFGIDAAVNRERTEVWRDVEVRARLDAPAEHEDGL